MLSRAVLLVLLVSLVASGTQVSPDRRQLESMLCEDRAVKERAEALIEMQRREDRENWGGPYLLPCVVENFEDLISGVELYCESRDTPSEDGGRTVLDSDYTMLWITCTEQAVQRALEMTEDRPVAERRAALVPVQRLLCSDIKETVDVMSQAVAALPAESVSVSPTERECLRDSMPEFQGYLERACRDVWVSPKEANEPFLSWLRSCGTEGPSVGSLLIQLLEPPAPI